MVDPVGCRRRDHRLGMERDAGAGDRDHVEIVGTVADGERVAGHEPQPCGRLTQHFGLCCPPEDRLLHRPRQISICLCEPVGAVLAKADRRGDGAGEGGEAAGHEERVGTMRIHGPDQRTRPGGERDAGVEDAADRRGWQAAQKGDALAQRRLELDLAVHRAGGDRGDVLLEPELCGELIDALLVDHGRIHVGDEQAAAAVARRLDDDVYGRLADIGTDRGDNGVTRPVGDREVAGDPRIQPVDRGCADRGGGPICEVGRHRRPVGVRDERGDEGHRKDLEAGLIGNAVLIAGPTASGKSAQALRLAAETGGQIVNADSMQVYSLPRILTARPDDAELAAAPHVLYGHVDPSEAYSTGRYVADVETLHQRGTLDGPAIFVGGTGLYFRALLEGLSPMPAIEPEARQRWRALLAAEGAERLHARLAERDAAAAATLRPGDGQRILRALEVHDASGRSILWWQAQRGRPLVDVRSARLIVLQPERALLRRRIDERFDRMIAEGALEEVRQLVARRLDPSLPAMKAIGVPELAAALDGKISVEDAVERAKAATRQYAKRQDTWFRNQFGPEWSRVEIR